MSSAPRGVSRLDSAPDLLAATLGDYQRTPRQAPPAPVRPDQGTPPPPAAPDWRTEAACRDHDTAVFFPESGGADAYDQARAICATCPSICACLAFADATRQSAGMWGGKEPAERGWSGNDGRRRTPKHGTRHRYLRGCRCDPCRRAEATYTREYRARKAAQS